MTTIGDRRLRDERWAKFPGIRLLRPSEVAPCEGVRWSNVSQTALLVARQNGGTEDEVLARLPERAHCKLKAKWKFRALPPLKDNRWDYPARSGRYCTHHLSVEIRNSPRESNRMIRWQDNHPEVTA